MVAGLLLAISTAGTPAQDILPLKAAIVANLIQFVQWPGEATWPAGTALTVCADRASPLWPHLEAIAARGAGAGRRLQLREMPLGAEGLRACHAWLADDAPAARRQAPAALAGHPVLVIGDVARADEPGVTIALRMAGDRIAFDVDLATARRCALEISSKLLRLAGKVRE